jgi:cytochrome c
MRSTLHTPVLAGLCSTGLLLSASAQAQAIDAEAAQALAKKEGCLKCHALDKKKEAKSLMEISKSLKGKAERRSQAAPSPHFRRDGQVR